MGFPLREYMRDIIKIAVFAIVVLALSPLAGFWIVALVGAALVLLPAGAVISAAFPKAWKQIENSLSSRTHFLPAA
jgi:hypothetical protein